MEQGGGWNTGPDTLNQMLFCNFGFFWLINRHFPNGRPTAALRVNHTLLQSTREGCFEKIRAKKSCFLDLAPLKILPRLSVAPCGAVDRQAVKWREAGGSQAVSRFKARHVEEATRRGRRLLAPSRPSHRCDERQVRLGLYGGRTRCPPTFSPRGAKPPGLWRFHQGQSGHQRCRQSRAEDPRAIMRSIVVVAVAV